MSSLPFAMHSKQLLSRLKNMLRGTKSSTTGLLDLSEELPMRIIDLHYQDVKVQLNYRHAPNRSARFLSLMLSCKILGRIAQKSFNQNTETFIRAAEMMPLRSSKGDKAFTQKIQCVNISCDGQRVLYPAKPPPNLSFEFVLFERFIRQQKIIKEMFTSLRNLHIKYSILLGHELKRMLLLVEITD